MNIKLLPAALLTAITAAGCIHPAPAVADGIGTAWSADCRPLAIGADGTGTGLQHALGNKTWIDAELDTWRAKGYRGVRVEYAANMTAAGRESGINSMLSEIGLHTEFCPGVPNVIVGMSEGSLVAAAVGRRLAAEGGYDATTRVVLYGEPASERQSGRELPDTKRICHANDPVCDPAADPVGQFTGAHTSYVPGSGA